VLASGQRPPDPAQLLAGHALDGFFDDIKESEYDYVLLDGRRCSAWSTASGSPSASTG
jgi:Mrp family chromosome partitioning ATPase